MPDSKDLDEFMEIQKELIEDRLLDPEVGEYQFQMTLNILRVTLFILRSEKYRPVFEKELMDGSPSHHFASLNDVCKRYRDAPDFIISVLMKAMKTGQTSQNVALEAAIADLEIA